MQSVQFHLLSWSEARSQASPVRRSVFIVEQSVPAELEWDEWDDVSMHCIASAADGQVIGTGRLLPDDERGTARIGRMAVSSKWRGRGIGAGILNALTEAAALRGTHRIELHAQVHAAAFYKRFGFREHDGIFDEAGIAHVAMTREISE
jgi:predicted GNAT family N-acyltransferase